MAAMDFGRERPTMRRGAAAALTVTLALAVAGCSSAGIDPALTTAVTDAVSSGASAQLGLELAQDDRILPGTLTALLGDMADELATAEYTIQMHQAGDRDDAAYREEALDEVRASLEAVHVAQDGEHAAGLAALTDSVEALRALEEEG
jgi:hypothetical protein